MTCQHIRTSKVTYYDATAVTLPRLRAQVARMAHRYV